MKSLTEKYRPRNIAAFAGLRIAKALMSKLARDPWQSAWLFVGDSGTGKTAMAFATANEMRAEVHHVASSKCTKETVDDLVGKCWYTPMFGGGVHVVIVDEADLMSPAAQAAFLSVLDGSGSFPPATVFIFTCNQTGKLEKRFLSRCRVVQFDSTVDAKDLGQFLYQVWWAEAPAHATAPHMAKLIEDSGSNVRAALMAIEMELLMVPARRVA